MKKITLSFLILVAFCYNSSAQAWFTKNGRITFFSSTPMEDIKADNNQVISVINTTTGEIQFSLLNNAFHFKKALMEEHFNADYIESAKYPKSTFKGTISNPGAVNFTSDGAYQVTVSGTLTIHGVTRTISVPGTITVSGGNVSATSTFKIKPKDYNISIPATVRNNIAESVEVTISCRYEKK
ncbi:MAG TPA: YceI family protein [Ferruginibacter sp.]|nr:YceI family protein [Ferruginibacter sp.]